MIISLMSFMKPVHSGWNYKCQPVDGEAIDRTWFNLHWIGDINTN
jgi:hypothetical protein